tara:strand:+ start:27 stop:761 length:735 start_codon:yes stop_codon:yes gene_type:complete
MVIKNLDLKINDRLEKSRKNVYNKYGLSVSNAIQLVIKKIIESNVNGTYVEAGVFNGSMLINIAQYLKENGKEFKLFGIDTFEGFPSQTIGHKYDNPDYFKILFKNGLITPDHYNKAIKRTSTLKKNEHLEKDYFKEISNLFEISKDFNNINLIKSSFCNIQPKSVGEIDILFIDCDLYMSYLDVLNKLYENVKDDGAIIFDEYYSLKYPGALVAINEFFSDKKGFFEKYITEEGFDRVCFIKK